MLYFVSVRLALGYLLFSFLSALGVLQFIVARYRLAGLAFLDYSKHYTRYTLAALLIASGVLSFFGGQWQVIFMPGPAGSELTILFGIGAACALAFTLIATPFLQQLRGTLTQIKDDEGREVAVGRLTGRLHIPANPTAPLPAICLVPGIANGERLLTPLARQMAQEGLIALVVSYDEGSYAYPGILAIVPAAMSVLNKCPEVDQQRLGVLGHDLGGDLIIRAASTDKQIKAIVALAPVLVDMPPSLDLLREMPYLQAMHWARNQKRAIVRIELNAIAYGTKLAPRPFLLLYGAEDRMVSRAPAEIWKTQQIASMQVGTIESAGHFDLVEHPKALQTVIQWFKEHL